MKTGLVSVSFRPLSYERIIEECVKANLGCIEWGSDVHAPCDDTEKLKKIEKENISTIEIDLSKEEKNISSDDISKILLESSEKKAWKYNSLEKKTYQRLFDVAEELGLVESPFITHELDGVHVDGCPLECRK